MNTVALELLCFYAYRTDEYPHRSESVTGAIKFLRQADLLDGQYRVTQRGQVYLKMVMATPLPELSYIDPRSKP